METRLKNFLHSNTAKVLMWIFVYLVVLFLGSILFTCGLGFRKRTMFLRMTYMIIAVVWSVSMIIVLAIRYNFSTLWHGMIEDIIDHQEDYERGLRRRYQDLITNYPLSIAEFESHCWHKDPRPSNPEIMEEALALGEEEWSKREAAARHKMEERRRAKALKKQAEQKLDK